MKISQAGPRVNRNQVLEISVDVHRDVLNFFFEAGNKEYGDECENRSTIIVGTTRGFPPDRGEPRPRR